MTVTSDAGTNMTIAHNLRKAKALILQEGWRKGGMGGRLGPKCLIGALFFTKEVVSEHYGTFSYAAQRCGRELLYVWLAMMSMEKLQHCHHLHPLSFYVLNDHGTTTKEDILHVLDTAADLAEQDSKT